MSLFFGHFRERKLLNILVKKFLENQEGIGSAFIFQGPSKVGKFTLAKEFPKLLNCENLSESENLSVACEKCPSCLRISNLSDPDVLVVDDLWYESGRSIDEVYQKSNLDQSHRIKNKAKTNTISVYDVRAIIKRLSAKNIAKYRFCIIKKAERMNEESANAMLKLIEEPPENTIFIFTTTNPERLLPTIVSRCQAITFKNLSESAYAAALREFSPDLELAELEKIMFLSQGRIGRGFDFLKNPDLYAEFTQIYRDLEKVFQGVDLKFRFDLAKKLAEKKGISLRFLRLMVYYLRHQLRSIGDFPSSEAEILRLTELIEQAALARKYIRSNIQPRLALENLFLQF